MPLGYNLVWMIGGLIGLPFFLMTMVRAKRRATVLHRLAWTSGPPVPTGRGPRPIWIHALSVGEVASAEPIVDGLRHCLPGHPLVVSASTQTGMQTAQRLFADKVQSIFYYPYDLLFSVRRTIRRVNPMLVIVVETDLWPNFLFSLKKMGVPALLVNARLSKSAFRGYRLFGGFSRNVLAAFEHIGVQSRSDAQRFVRLGAGADKVVVTGNIKFDRKGGPDPLAAGHELRMAMGIDPGRLVILLGSTHHGEEMEGLAVFCRLRNSFRRPLLIVAPRDPGRAGAIEKLARGRGLAVRFLSTPRHDAAHGRPDVLVVNTIGILRQLYAVADIAFVGGSLVPEGGHNPLEPAACGKPILFGPDMSDFETIAGQLVQAGAAFYVRNGSEWYQASRQLLADAALRSRMGRRALGVFELNRGAVDKTIQIVARTVSKRGGDRGCPEQNN